LNPVFLDEWESKDRLKKYGLPTPHGALATAGIAGDVAETIGYPVVVKAVGKEILHKSDLNAVKLHLAAADEVSKAVGEISESVGKSFGYGGQDDAGQFIVEQMVNGAVAELIIGVKRDEQFGPALVIGAGGILVELMADSVSLLLPTDRASVAEAIESLSVARLLKGFRGGPAGDIDACIDAILSIADFAEDHWESLVELDVNPLMVLPRGRGVVAADALICINHE
jgi:succinyl-CoA synthetase beta subunit